MGVFHPVGDALEAARRGVQGRGLLAGHGGGVQGRGLLAGHGEGAGGGADRGNIAVVQVGKPFFQPGLLVVAGHELRQPGQTVALAGVEQAGDLRCLREAPGGPSRRLPSG